MYNDLKRIYEAISDEQSRYIFIQRLNYSLTGRQAFIRDMIQHEIKYYSNADQMFQLISWLNDKTGKIILFGGGFAGYQIASTLADYDFFVDYICDNNSSLWGKKRFDIEVISPKKLATFDERIVVIVGVNSGRENVIQQLKDIGCINNVFIPYKDWWLGPYYQYFDEEILPKPVADEVFIDGGALDGGDTRRFFNWTCGKGISFLIEPDRDNADRIRDNKKISGKINVLERGLWDHSTILRFNSGKNENSTISEDGDIEIQTVSIDEIETPSPISFIKMDIEGSEGKALIGAKKPY